MAIQTIHIDAWLMVVSLDGTAGKMIAHDDTGKPNSSVREQTIIVYCARTECFRELNLPPDHRQRFNLEQNMKI